MNVLFAAVRLSTNLALFFNDWVGLQHFAAATGSMLSELLTRNIMQDLVKNLSRFLNVS